MTTNRGEKKLKNTTLQVFESLSQLICGKVQIVGKLAQTLAIPVNFNKS